MFKLTLTNCNLLTPGTPEPNVVWTKGGKKIQTGGRFSTSSDAELHTLAISDAKESDSGTYRATATSEAGEIFSDIEVQVVNYEVEKSGQR